MVYDPRGKSVDSKIVGKFPDGGRASNSIVVSNATGDPTSSPSPKLKEGNSEVHAAASKMKIGVN